MSQQSGARTLRVINLARQPDNVVNHDDSLKILNDACNREHRSPVLLYDIDGADRCGKSALISKWMRSPFLDNPSQHEFAIAWKLEAVRASDFPARVLELFLTNRYWRERVTKLSPDWGNLSIPRQNAVVDTEAAAVSYANGLSGDNQVLWLYSIVEQFAGVLILDQVESMMSSLGECVDGERLLPSPFTKFLVRVSQRQLRSLCVFVTRRRPLCFENSGSFQDIKLGVLSAADAQSLFESHLRERFGENFVAENMAEVINHFGCNPSIIATASKSVRLVDGNGSRTIDINAVSETMTQADRLRQLRDIEAKLSDDQWSLVLALALFDSWQRPTRAQISHVLKTCIPFDTDLQELLSYHLVNQLSCTVENQCLFQLVGWVRDACRARARVDDAVRNRMEAGYALLFANS